MFSSVIKVLKSHELCRPFPFYRASVGQEYQKQAEADGVIIIGTCRDSSLSLLSLSHTQTGDIEHGGLEVADG